MNSTRPVTDPTAPSRARADDTPATTTTTPTAIQPRPWISVPISSPGAPPSTAAAPIRSTRSPYGPPASIITDTSPPMAGNRRRSRRPVANPTAIGTHTASTASVIVAQGTGTFFGRMISASHCGTMPLSRSGTARRAPLSSRVPFMLATLSARGGLPRRAERARASGLARRS
jgi:hypothetical protein